MNHQTFKNYLLTLFILLGFGITELHAQNQKVWTGSSKLFGINGATNPTSSVTWNLGLGTASTSSKTDSIVSARAIYTRVNWSNPTTAMIVDTLKVFETVNACPGLMSTKLVEVYPLPICSIGSNQILCAGVAPASFTLSITNYSAISGIKDFPISYEVRAGLITGTALGGTSTGSTTLTTASTTINPSTWPSMTAGTTYYFVITSFGSSISATGTNPAPGNIGLTGTGVSAYAILPSNNTFTISTILGTPIITPY